MRNNKNEKGSVLVLVLLITAIIAGLGTAYVLTASTQQKQVDSSIDNQSYDQAALSGFDMARAYLLVKNTPDTVGWDTELALCNALSTSYYAVSSTFPSAPSTTVPLASYTTSFQWCRNIDYHGNTFFAKVENNTDGGSAVNDTDNIVKVTVEGWGNGNDPLLQRSQTTVVEGLVQFVEASFIPTGALVVGGSLKVYGSASISGSQGNIQANGPVTISGSANIVGNVTSSGVVNNTGTVAGTITQNASPTPIPPIDPAAYKYLATKIFKTDGKVYTPGGALTATPTGWSYSGGLWSRGGNGTTDTGVFYFEGGSNANVKITSSPGSNASPWYVTILAEGYINMAGSPCMAPAPGGGNIACMTRMDLQMRGTASTSLIGLFASHEQVSMVGNPHVVGCVLAEDQCDNCSLVSSSSTIDVQIGGNADIHYDGGLTTALTDGFRYVGIHTFKKSIKKRYP